MYNGSQQICTWRNCGGTQYGETFPQALEVSWAEEHRLDMAERLQERAGAPGSRRGDWRTRSHQVRRLIQEYRARQAFGDFGVWSTAYKKLLNDNWNSVIKPEWSPYWINAAT